MRRKECVSRCFDICFDMLRCSLIEKRRVFKGQRHITTNTIRPAAPRPSTFIKPIRPRQTKTKKFAQTKIRLNTFKYVETCIISIEFVYNPQQEFWDCLGEHSTPTSISVENPRSNGSKMVNWCRLMSPCRHSFSFASHASHLHMMTSLASPGDSRSQDFDMCTGSWHLPWRHLVTRKLNWQAVGLLKSWVNECNECGLAKCNEKWLQNQKVVGKTKGLIRDK